MNKVEVEMQQENAAERFESSSACEDQTVKTEEKTGSMDIENDAAKSVILTH